MEKECCPKFDSKKWDNKMFIWKNKLFIKEAIPTFFHIPFPPMIGKRIVKMMNLASNAKKVPIRKEGVLILFLDSGLFKSEIYYSVTGNVPKANNTRISGTFMSKVFVGDYGAIPKFIKQMNESLAKTGQIAKEYYVHYAYCPKCAKKYGGNSMILFARIKSIK
jgi:hypothetical protein